MLQETKASDIQIEGFRSKAKKKGYILKAHKATGAAHARSAGVLLAWKRTLEVTPHPDMPSNERTVAVNIRTKATGSVTLATVYLPPGNPLAHDSAGSEVLQEILRKATDNGDRLVLGGVTSIPRLRAWRNGFKNRATLSKCYAMTGRLLWSPPAPATSTTSWSRLSCKRSWRNLH